MIFLFFDKKFVSGLLLRGKMSYPDIEDSDFYNKLYGKKEFNENTYKIPGIKQEPYQQFVRKYINKSTPYESLFLYWNLGAGKGLGSISITENFKDLIAQKNGLDKFLIITKSKTLQNVYRRELAKFFYASEREQQLVNQGNKAVIKTVRQRINNYYEFINYDELTNRVIGQVKTSEMTDKKRRDIKEEKAITDFNNRIVVIDEIQNLTGNYRYLSILKTLRNSKNVKLILLSATPMTNSADEMIYIANLLNWKNPPFDLDEETLRLTEHSNIQLEKALKKLYKQGILEVSKIKIANQNDKKEEEEKTINLFTSQGEKILLESLKGKVSYQPLDPINFPKKIRIGEPITNRPGSLKIFKCPMSSYQERAYLYARETNQGSFYGNLSEISTIAYEGLVPEEWIDSNNLKKTSLKEKDLYQYSSKLYSVLKNIQNSPGICFIYSNAVENGGTKLVAEMLKQNGYVSYSSNYPNNKSYILYSDKLTEKERSDYEKIVNSVDNVDGSKIKIVIGSPLIAEGLSFFNVRQIHILDPHWNLTRTLQAEGRCIRNFSHYLLAPEDRNVSIYWYVSTLDSGEETIDHIKYLICEEKDRSIKNMERKIKQIAIDCYNYKQTIAKNKIKNEKAYQDYYKDFSPECDYQNCEYQCLYIDENKIKDYQKADLALTYNKETDPYQISLAKKLLKKLFEYNDVYRTDMIEESLSESGLNPYNIYWALNDLVSKKETFLVSKKGLGYIAYIKKYYKLIIIEKQKKQESKNISQFLNSFLTPEAESSRMAENRAVQRIIQEKKQTVEENPVINKLYSISEFSEQKGSDLIGLVENGIFKIVDMSKNKKQGTNRDFSRGKQCLFFDKKKLQEFSQRLGLDVSGNKSNYCEALLKELEKRKLVIYLDE